MSLRRLVDDDRFHLCKWRRPSRKQVAAKPRHSRDQQQHVMEEAMGVGDANGEDDHADSTERAVAGDDYRRRLVELHVVLNPRFLVTDEMAIDKVRRCFAVQCYGEL